MSALHKITRARSALITSQPFFGCLALGLEVVERADVGTMATDGRKLYFAPAFVESLAEPELIGVMAHEVLHCAYLHHTRRGNRDPKQWNVAADYAINRDLVAAGFTLPKSALLSPRFDGMGAEAIYSALAKEQAAQPQPAPGAGQPQQGQQQASGGQQGQQGGQPGQGQPNGPGQPGGPAGDDPGGCGGVMDADPDAGGMQEAESDWQARARQAVNVAKAHNAGTVPGDLVRLVETLNAPRNDWRAILRRFIDESARRDFSWTRPNRRHIAAGLHLPGYVPDGLNRLVILVDTSGSIDADILASFAGEISAAVDDGAADAVTVVYADTKVRQVEEYQAGDMLELRPIGGGGTDFRDAFRWIADNAPDASAVVHFTDLECSQWGDEPPCPVLWAQWGDSRRVPPFGEVLAIE